MIAVTILRNTLKTILLEAKEPIIKVYAQSALDQTNGVENDLKEINRLRDLAISVYHDCEWSKIVDEMQGSTTTEQKMELRKRMQAFEDENNL